MEENLDRVHEVSEKELCEGVVPARSVPPREYNRVPDPRNSFETEFRTPECGAQYVEVSLLPIFISRLP